MVKGGVGSRSARHPMMKHEYFKQLIVAFYSHASAIKKNTALCDTGDHHQDDDDQQQQQRL